MYAEEPYLRDTKSCSVQTNLQLQLVTLYS